MGINVVLGILAILVFTLILPRLFSRSDEIMGQATVKSQRIVHRSELPKEDARWLGLWNYLVTFSLSDGEEIELYTIPSDYRDLKQGDSGLLTWQGKRLLGFETDG